MMNRKILLVLVISVLMLSGCVTTKQADEKSVMTKEEIIDMKLKQTLAISETSLEVSKNAEKIANEAFEKSRQAESTSTKALESANHAIEAANEARKFAENEAQKAIEAANESRKFAENEAKKAINAANESRKFAENEAKKAIDAANESSEKSIAIANQTLAEINRLRATIMMKPPEEPIIMEEPKVERTYRIKKGDTLSKIAQKYYGDASKWVLIYKRNRHVIKDPNIIAVDTIIFIP